MYMYGLLTLGLISPIHTGRDPVQLILSTHNIIGTFKEWKTIIVTYTKREVDKELYHAATSTPRTGF